MGLTADARFALVALVCVLGAISLARWESAEHPVAVPVSEQPPAGAEVAKPTGQGVALRDGRPLDPNLASAAELELLPGVGPSLAGRIVQARTEAPFSGPDDLLRVKGIGARTLARLRPLLTFASPRTVPVQASPERDPSEQVEHAADP